MIRAFIEPNAVRSRRTPPRLLVAVDAHCGGRQTLILSLVEPFESVGRRVEGGF